MIIDVKMQVQTSNTLQFINPNATIYKQMKSLKGTNDISDTIQATTKHFKMDQTSPTFTL
jgi:hypothetical protein